LRIGPHHKLLVKAAAIVLVNRLPFSADNVVTFVKSAIPLPIEQKFLDRGEWASGRAGEPASGRTGDFSFQYRRVLI